MLELFDLSFYRGMPGITMEFMLRLRLALFYAAFYSLDMFLKCSSVYTLKINWWLTESVSAIIFRPKCSIDAVGCNISCMWAWTTGLGCLVLFWWYHYWFKMISFYRLVGSSLKTEFDFFLRVHINWQSMRCHILQQLRWS